MTRRILILLLAGTLAACGGPSSDPDGGEPNEQMPDGGSNVDGPDGGSNVDGPDGGGEDTPDGGDEPVEGTVVGPAGGTVTVGDVTLQIPADALSVDTTITITETAITPPQDVTAISKAYDFGPDGLTFAKPVFVIFSARGEQAGAKVYWSKPGGAAGYDALTSQAHVDQTSGQLFVGAQVTHFSIGFVGGLPLSGPVCSPVDVPFQQLANDFHPVASMGFVAGSPRFGPDDTVFIGSGERGLSFASYDGVEFLPVVPESGAFADRATGDVWLTRSEGQDVRVFRQAPYACPEPLGRIPAAFEARILGVGPDGRILAAARVRSPASEWHSFLGTATDDEWTRGTRLENDSSRFRESDPVAVWAPSDPQRVYLGWGTRPALARVSRSNDGGVTWTVGRVPTDTIDVGENYVVSLAVDPTDANLAYAATTRGTLFRTTDGTTWERVSEQVPGVARQVRITSDRRIFVASLRQGTTNTGGLYWRAHDGTAWAELAGDLPADQRRLSGFDLRENGAALEFLRISDLGVLFRSTDSGATWTEETGTRGLGAVRSYEQLTHPTDANTFYGYTGTHDSTAGLWRTTDGGVTFTATTSRRGVLGAVVLGNGNVIGIDGQLDSPMVFSTDGLSFQTATGITLDSWGSWSDPFGDPPRYPILIGYEPATAYMKEGTNLWRTTDGGASWQQVTTPDLSLGQSQWTTATLFVDRGSPARLLAWRTTDETFSSWTLLRSADGGTTWQPLTLPAGISISDTPVNDTTGRLYLRGFDQAQFAPKLFVLPSGSDTFVERTIPQTLMGAQLVTVGQYAVLNAFTGGGAYSADGGATWTDVTPTARPPWLLYPKAFFHRADPQRLLVETGTLYVGLLQ